MGEGYKMMLTPQQEAFIASYMTCFDVKVASRAAGLTPKKGRALLDLPEMAQEMSLRLRALSEESAITATRVLEELARVAFLDPAEFYNDDGTVKGIKEISERARRAIQSYSVAGEDGATTVKASDKLRALELLGRYLGLFKDKLELTGMGNLVSDLERARARRREAEREVTAEGVDVHALPDTPALPDSTEGE